MSVGTHYRRSGIKGAPKRLLQSLVEPEFATVGCHRSFWTRELLLGQPAVHHPGGNHNGSLGWSRGHCCPEFYEARSLPGFLYSRWSPLASMKQSGCLTCRVWASGWGSRPRCLPEDIKKRLPMRLGSPGPIAIGWHTRARLHNRTRTRD
jgi:hypothetical protein